MGGWGGRRSLNMRLPNHATFLLFQRSTSQTKVMFVPGEPLGRVWHGYISGSDVEKEIYLVLLSVWLLWACSWSGAYPFDAARSTRLKEICFRTGAFVLRESWIRSEGTFLCPKVPCLPSDKDFRPVKLYLAGGSLGIS